MLQPPDHYHDLSLRLSEVLGDIGVNEQMVTLRRKMYWLNEATAKLFYQISDIPTSSFYFGSQVEGSTTRGLRSDIDSLCVFNSQRAIQNWPEWEPGKWQWLMIQNDRTSPGYCLLQRLRSDEPLPVQDFQDEHHTVDNTGRVLLRHSLHVERINGREVRHGPAALTHGIYNRVDHDHVHAISCSSWPKEALPWLQQQHVSGWPRAEMKRYSESQGCFVVPVSSKTRVYPDLEWRISTSQAERCLMLNLNMTQMRCYILMKMMLKTFIDPKYKDVISSFMCKNVLFRCIAVSPAAAWREPLIIQCLIQCLEALLNCVLTGNCPHFIIPGNNLLAGKLTVTVKQQLVLIMCDLIQNIEQTVLSIGIDDIGERLRGKSVGLTRRVLYSADQVAAELVVFSAKELHRHGRLFRAVNTDVASSCDQLTRSFYRLLEIYTSACTMEQLACQLLVPFLCSQLGSIIASEDIQHARGVSNQALQWFSLGLKFDASSSRLKLASALHCSGDIVRSEVVLASVKRQIEQTPTFSFCCCTYCEFTITMELDCLCYEKHEQVIKDNIMFCVHFLQCEVHCVPKELRYEMFRSTLDDLPYTGEYDNWMDWAVVDSIPFLYFLQYKVYSQLKRSADKQTALGNLIQTIYTEPNLHHQETALNLLGQCMEQENRWLDALQYYKFSLNVRSRNNAAKWHICRVLLHCFQNR